jgi:hypothetical protein
LRGARRLIAAEGAVEVGAEVLAAALFGGDPFAELEGGLVAEVLGVAAVEVGDPVGVLVLVVAGDGGGGDEAEARGEGREGFGAEGLFERGEPLALFEVDVLFELAREGVEAITERGAGVQGGDDLAKRLVVAFDAAGVAFERRGAAAMGEQGSLFGAEVGLEVTVKATSHVGDERRRLSGDAGAPGGRGVAEGAG